MMLRFEHERAIQAYIEQIAALGGTAIRIQGSAGGNQAARMRDNLNKVLHLSFACGKLSETSRKGLDSE